MLPVEKTTAKRKILNRTKTRIFNWKSLLYSKKQNRRNQSFWWYLHVDHTQSELCSQL